jgi:Second Messenger Oligonucleotide or Dinucleotide Synthetase domain
VGPDVRSLLLVAGTVDTHPLCNAATKAGISLELSRMTGAVLNRQNSLSVQSRPHRRLCGFVDWIRPDPDTREVIRKQAGNIRSAIKYQAESDGLAVTATPDGGSFAKHTGLRRHMRGDSEIEGQDVDLPFVVRAQTADGEEIGQLLSRFDRYAGASYPNTPRTITGSSNELRFVGTKLNYDLVPMLVSGNSDYQIILKKDGSRRITSVAKHTEFVRRRTRTATRSMGV